MAFVIVIHTHPDHPTRIPELLRRKSPVKVVLIQDAMTVETDTVYVPPSDQDTIIEDGVLRLQERSRRSHVHMPIDIFLRSLAEERGDRAGCIILSGTGTDGTGGLRLIKENAGVAVAQARKSARHDRAFQDYEIGHRSKTTGYKLLRLNARRLRDADPDQDRILLAIETMSASEAQQPTDKKG